jgi:exopolyphosphatase/guanosine-5'-triphosphate,3'-diphosphate pyrophosphatase
MPAPTDTVAAVDLGSNSFHMVVARVVDDEVYIVDRLRERVALAAGLDADKRIDKDARERALAALSLFGQRLAHMPPGSVRAVGTNTLRQARNPRAFLTRAEEALGHRIEIISGREEARLIYVGVAHTQEELDGRRLVVDIGGGSTECIIGERFEASEADSLYMGCVTFSERFFPKNEIRQKHVDAAQLAASLELQSIEERYKSVGWTRAVGSSGTILSVESILHANEWSNRGITAKGLRRLRKALVAAGSTADLALLGMPPDRADVLPGGVAILSAVFERLGIERMFTSTGALREGLVYDLLGRIRHEDTRDKTIRTFSERYAVDRLQAERVERTALGLLDGVKSQWDLEGEDARQMLSWAARLHEIGKAISFSGHHKHGAYIVAESEMAGFSREDQQVLAALILAHRRKLRPSRFDALPVEGSQRATRLAILLRLAVLLNRARATRSVPEILVEAKKRSLHLAFPPGWLDGNPLTRADLENEAAALESSGTRITLA